MYQRFVTRPMAMCVIELFEIIHIQQCDTQRRAATFCARLFAFENVIQSAPVEAAGQLVFARKFTHLDKLGFQLVDFGFGVLHFPARCQHFIACIQRFCLHRARIAHDVVEYRTEFVDIACLGDFPRVGVHFFMVIAGADGDCVQTINEDRDHVLHRDLGFCQAVFQRALFVDDFLEAARGVFQRMAIDRAGDDVLHHVDLAV